VIFILGLYKSIYNMIPTSIISPIVKIFNLKPYSNKKIWKKVEELLYSLDLFQKDPESMIQYFNKQLDLLHSYAIKISTFWNNHLKNLNELNVDSLQYCKPIDSNILRKEFYDIVNFKIPGYITSTGGSGRSPSKLYLSDESYYLDRINVLSHWKQTGYKCGDKKLTLRGVNIGKNLTKINPIYNELLVNIFLMNESNAYKIFHKIKNFNPTFGQGYPSVFMRLAEIFKKNKIEYYLKGISFASESFTEYQRQIVQDTFKCKVLSSYGHSERAAFAMERIDKKGTYLIVPTCGLIEILKENGKRAKEGEMGEITCTGFINRGMPLIRYQTGDYATVCSIYKGIVIEMKNIIGRWGKDFVVDKKGNNIPTTAINVHSKVQYKFKYIQIWQKKPGIINIKLVPWKYDQSLNYFMKKIKKDFQEKLIDVEIIINISTEDELYISHRGKVPYLVSELFDNKRY